MEPKEVNYGADGGDRHSKNGTDMSRAGARPGVVAMSEALPRRGQGCSSSKHSTGSTLVIHYHGNAVRRGREARLGLGRGHSSIAAARLWPSRQARFIRLRRTSQSQRWVPIATAPRVQAPPPEVGPRGRSANEAVRRALSSLRARPRDPHGVGMCFWRRMSR
jgi:hypothetical protein